MHFASPSPMGNPMFLEVFRHPKALPRRKHLPIVAELTALCQFCVDWKEAFWRRFLRQTNSHRHHCYTNIAFKTSIVSQKFGNAIGRIVLVLIFIHLQLAFAVRFTPIPCSLGLLPGLVQLSWWQTSSFVHHFMMKNMWHYYLM